MQYTVEIEEIDREDRSRVTRPSFKEKIGAYTRYRL
jgi:hypothetical protein